MALKSGLITMTRARLMIMRIVRCSNAYSTGRFTKRGTGIALAIDADASLTSPCQPVGVRALIGTKHANKVHLSRGSVLQLELTC